MNSLAKKQVEVYTDGACSGNPGPGGWGVVLRCNGAEKELSGYDAATTNNRMELTAAIVGLETLKEPCQVTLYTDSQYIAKAINDGWLMGWKKNGWRKSDKKPVLNVELWQAFDAQLARHQVSIRWVKGHADNAYNNRCDALATGEIAQRRGGN